MTHRLTNEAEILDFNRRNFRIFCNQFGEPTMSGRKTPESGWRVVCKKIDRNHKKEGQALTDWPPFLRLKAINKKLGVSVIVELEYNTPYFHPQNVMNPSRGYGFRGSWQIKRKTTGSGYEIVKRGSFTVHDHGPANQPDEIPQNLTSMAEEVSAKEDIPEPRYFKEESFSNPAKENGEPTMRVENTCQICSIYVKGVVSLQSRTVTMDPPQRPDQSAFFFCDGWSHQGATFNLITDGEIFYPVTRYSNSTRKVKIRNDFGKSSLDPTSFNAIDKMLIQKAIEIYIERTFNNAEASDNN